jgi:hypothetical protein
MSFLAETFHDLALETACYIDLATRAGEGDELEMALVLPFPPSTNHLYSSRIESRLDGGPYARRVKSGDYESWIREAGFAPYQGKWRRFTDEVGYPARWGMIIVAVGMAEKRDVSNTYKPVEDLVAVMTGLQDKLNYVAPALRLDLSPALKTMGLRTGLYVLVEELEE